MLNACWKMGCHTGASSSLYVFRIEAHMLSGPEDLRVERCWPPDPLRFPHLQTPTATDSSTSLHLSDLPVVSNLVKKVLSSFAEPKSSLVTIDLWCLHGIPVVFFIVSHVFWGVASLECLLKVSLVCILCLPEFASQFLVSSLQLACVLVFES